MRGKMTPLCRRHFEINYNEWKLLYFDLTLFRVCSTSTHESGYHVSRAVVTQAGQLWPIWPNLANLTGKLQTTFFQWQYLNSDWYYIEVCFKGIIYNKSVLHCFVVLIRKCHSSCYKYNNWCKASKLIAPALTTIWSQFFKMGSWKKNSNAKLLIVLLVFYYFHNYHFDQ